MDDVFIYYAHMFFALYIVHVCRCTQFNVNINWARVDEKSSWEHDTCKFKIDHDSNTLHMHALHQTCQTIFLLFGFFESMLMIFFPFMTIIFPWSWILMLCVLHQTWWIVSLSYALCAITMLYWTLLVTSVTHFFYHLHPTSWQIALYFWFCCMPTCASNVTMNILMDMICVATNTMKTLLFQVTCLHTWWWWWFWHFASCVFFAKLSSYCIQDVEQFSLSSALSAIMHM
jgi:hypothetical protein